MTERATSSSPSTCCARSSCSERVTTLALWAGSTSRNEVTVDSVLPHPKRVRVAKAVSRLRFIRCAPGDYCEAETLLAIMNKPVKHDFKGMRIIHIEQDV